MTSQHDGQGTGSEARLRAPWSRSERPVPRLLVRPLRAFLETEAAGGILLFLAAVAALVWANSPWPDSYDRLWHTEFTLRLGPWAISEDLRHWINDALMAVFFFVVGLEIKRELANGELRDLRAAALPAFAAFGGMAGPALIYAAINAGGPGSRGWGIPMATDIAFAVGVLAVVGRRLPSGLKLFLLSLAIVDDIGAITVIALFYSDHVFWGPLAVAALLLGLIALLKRIHVRWLVIYVVLGIGAWLAVFESGVHGTLAGVALALLTPAAPFQRPHAVSQEARRVADDTVDDPQTADADAHLWLGLAGLSREAISPLARLEHALHPLTSFGIVPLFALANAGVDLRAEAIGAALSSPIALGVAAGLVGGKVVGISLVSWLATRMRMARLPEGVEWRHVVGVSALAGVGFTVSLFIAGLAFEDQASLEAAKVGILGGSIIAGSLGALFLRAASRLASLPARPTSRT